MTKNIWYAVCFFLGSLFGSYAYDLVYKKPEQEEQTALFVQKEDSIILNIGDIWVYDLKFVENPFDRTKSIYNMKYKILDIKEGYILFCIYDNYDCDYQRSETISEFIRHKIRKSK